VVVTPSFNLGHHGIRHIIHTVGPDCRIKAQNNNRKKLLQKVYRNSLAINMSIDDKMLLRAMAFPSISTGVYAYPLEEAAQVAIETIASVIEQGNFLLCEVRMVLFS